MDESTRLLCPGKNTGVGCHVLGDQHSPCVHCWTHWTVTSGRGAVPGALAKAVKALLQQCPLSYPSAPLRTAQQDPRSSLSPSDCTSLPARCLQSQELGLGFCSACGTVSGAWYLHEYDAFRILSIEAISKSDHWRNSSSISFFFFFKSQATAL